MAQHNIKFTPKWIIFLLDLSCCLAAMVLAFLLRFNLHFLTIIEDFNIIDILLITAAVNGCILLAFKTYAGIIRYTSLEDTSRIMSVNIIAFIILFVIQQIYPRNDEGYSFIPTSVLAIYFICVNFIMILYRILVRKLFHEFFAVRRKKVKAILYGAGLEGILAKRMFTENQRSDIKIIAIVEDSIKMIGKIVENTTVYKASKFNIERLKKDGAELLIIADPFIKRDRLNELVDLCLELNIRVLQVPPSEKWINNKLDVNQLKSIKIEQLLEREVINIENKKVGEDIKGKTILVTGAAGSIGSEITRIILKYEPAMVIALDNAETPLHALKISLQDNQHNLKTFIGDITDKNRLEQIFEVYAPNLIYHAAAYKHVPIMEEHPSIAVINNVYGTKLLAELAVSYGVEKFVMVSTDKAVNPTNVMGASKRIAEIFTQSLNSFTKAKDSNVFGQIDYPVNSTKFITTRFGNVLGSNGSVIPLFRKQLEEGGPITITHPDITRYFMTIPEACQLVIEAGSMGKGGEIFVFDMGKPVKIVDLARKMISLSGKTPDVDIKISFTGLRQGEKLYEELLNNAENTIPTYHTKILIAQVREYDFDMVVNQVNDLIRLANKHLAMETVSKMKEIVPEFISNNSVFQKLDK